MLFTIITVTRNGAKTLMRTLQSVANQRFTDYEHLVIDGGSTDNTVELLSQFAIQHPALRYISEPDRGTYDAINKGIRMACGEIIALLHADDFYADNYVLQRYARVFEAHPVDAVYSDLVYVGNSQIFREKTDVVIRYLPRRLKPALPYQQMGFSLSVYGGQWKKRHFIQGYPIIRNWVTHRLAQPDRAHLLRLLHQGWMPPHPTLLVKREVLQHAGGYRTDKKIASDYEMILRLFLQEQIRTYYLPVTTYCMTVGGLSNGSWKNILRKSREDYQTMKQYHFPHPMLALAWKNISKIPQFFRR
ncbi:glycosyltransferase family 2 protein [Thermoflavifilum thermophilum]|uniref:Glycosyltransferase involved in cell wall bisynthesis n=1 Tax=Thermoflavifilum thermophilum TaxID=1393122 RepID=A0A1I7N9I3_9BACT|nr:glycosyltransferase family 2 protein [Thermoflavifilum thermophilum]SFV31332.1 Glycosyltransferase involved in cell wall bisynthesis [Thermoflavifilum thermophilum]